MSAKRDEIVEALKEGLRQSADEYRAWFDLEYDEVKLDGSFDLRVVADVMMERLGITDPHAESA